MKSPSPRSEQTRQLIIETAAPIFNKKGYVGTSMSDLTTATGLTKGSIYGNFKDKDDVAMHAFQHNINLIFDFFSKEIKAATGTMDKLLAYPRGFRKIYRMVLAYGGCPILNTAVEADDTHVALRRMAMEALTRWKANIIGLVTRGIAEGVVDPAVDAAKTAEVLIALLEGGIALSKVTGEESYLLNAIEMAENQVVGLQSAQPST